MSSVGAARPSSFITQFFAVVPLLLVASGCASTHSAHRESAMIQITRNGSQPPIQGPADHFIGVVRVSSPFQTTPPARVSGATVTFEPGARTAWHSHPLGQTLLVVSGVGRVQREGGPLEEIRPGDVVWIPPNVKHWHGAAPDSSMSHVAINEAQDGTVVTWLEQVPDAVYTAIPVSIRPTTN